MIPTPEQKQWLKDYLYQSLSYRETYDEVYDHIILALEHKPAREFFASNVNDIIDEDFGGSINMLNMEVEYTYTVKADIRFQFRNNFKNWFKFPLIVFTATALFCLYCLALRFIIPALVLLGIGFLVPIIMFACRGFIVGYKFIDTKTSIKDGVLRKLTYGAFGMIYFIGISCSLFVTFAKFIFNGLFEWHFQITKAQNHAISCVIISLITTTLIINALAIFKLYHGEFKTSMIKA